MATDYPLVGPPSITVGQFASVLATAHSPAAPEAASMYAAITRQGIDPAVVLAIMQHESNFGRAGIAVGRQNGFGSRYYAGIPGATNRGGWASFTSWTAGAAYTASLLAGSRYAGSSNANTARTFPTVYAPSSDGNNPSSYGATIVNTINRWKGMPAVAAPKAAAKPAAKPSTTVPAATAPAAPAAAGGGLLTPMHALVIVGGVAILAVLVKR